MAPIFLLALGGLALYAMSQSSSKSVVSKAKKSFDGTVIPVPATKGYDIVVPCKEFNIYNEEASYQYAYYEFTKILPEYITAFKNKDQDKIATMIDAFQLKMFGCDSEKNNTEMLIKYYAWIYRMIRAGLKALIDNSKLKKDEAVQQANSILAAYLEALKSPPLNLDISGLPTSVEGDFLQ